MPDDNQDIDLDDDQRSLLAHLPRDGATISNPALRRALGWETNRDTDRYYAARNALEDAGRLIRGVGKGGTVRLVVAREAAGRPESLDVELLEPSGDNEAAFLGELALYEPMRNVIAGDWARARRADPLVVEVTGLQGGKPTGGIWSRPDITSVEVRTFAHVPGRHLEVTTFEIKPSNRINVQAVYEALAHRRAATRSYVLLHVPPAREHELEADVADIATVARSHGIGLVTAGDPEDHDTWDELEAALRVDPDPGELEKFIATQLSPAARASISLSVR